MIKVYTKRDYRAGVMAARVAAGKSARAKTDKPSTGKGKGKKK